VADLFPETVGGVAAALKRFRACPTPVVPDGRCADDGAALTEWQSARWGGGVRNDPLLSEMTRSPSSALTTVTGPSSSRPAPTLLLFCSQPA
jgi:hypothetical protein